MERAKRGPRRRVTPGCWLAVVSVLACPPSASAALGPSAFVQDQAEAGEAADSAYTAGWEYGAELSLLFTSGNATVRTFGLGGSARRDWAAGELSLVAGGLRTESGTTTRVAVGTQDDFEVLSEANPKPTAENYFLRGAFERAFSEDVHLTMGAGWERNTFAGFESRLSLVGGIGNIWVENETTRLKSDYGLTLTAQNDVIDDPGKGSTFGGVRVSTSLRRRLTATADFESALIVDESLANTRDLRADFANSLALDINHLLAVKTGLRFVWDNAPALTEAPLLGSAGTPTGETVLVPRHKLDSTFTIALVAHF